MTNEYIRKDDAVYVINSKCYELKGLAKNITKGVQELPPADVAPVVRCKDCLFFTTEKSCCRPEGLIKAREDDFCSHGERREE